MTAKGNSSAFSIVWFRQDLRLADNPALVEAASKGRVLPIYILDDENAADWAMGGASRVWLHHSLSSLDQSLGQRLRFFRGDARAVIRRLVEELPVAAVYWNRCYEPWRMDRDRQIKTDLQSKDILVQSFNGSLLWEPWTVQKEDQTPYRVFTPFFRKAWQQFSPRAVLAEPRDLCLFQDPINAEKQLSELDLIPKPDWHQAVMQRWQVGEKAAMKRLHHFQDQQLTNYQTARDFPALESTSRLAPYLHFGEISPHQIWQALTQESFSDEREDYFPFLRQLAWREFSNHLLFQFPDLAEKNFNSKFDAFEWIENPEHLARWQSGKTGYPIVDAGMRELRQTGIMHNRVRMIVASFLIKNLLQHWHFGEKWFWDNLLEADLANNSAGWQWCAGSGADASPYYRIFNPLRQSEKFDVEADYLVKYCPELARLPQKFRHQPWEASTSMLNEAGIRLGKDYPKPMVDLKTTRERALERFKSLRQAS